MNLLQAILMGIIQGLTEFLPVSSSGHLAIFKNLFHINTETGVLFDVLLHVGTLAAIFVVYWKDVRKLIVEGCKIVGLVCQNLIIFFKNVFGKQHLEYKRIITTTYRKFVVMILISTIPTGIIGVLLKDVVESASDILIIPGVCLIVTAFILFVCDRAEDGDKKAKTATYWDSLILGVSQGVATLPGISRSGTTITVCRLLGFDKAFAVKYSFIMSIPAILGATVLELKDIFEHPIVATNIVNYIVGMIVAAVVGYIALKTVVVLVKKNKFKYFSYYCLVLGVISVIGFIIEKIA